MDATEQRGESAGGKLKPFTPVNLDQPSALPNVCWQASNGHSLTQIPDLDTTMADDVDSSTVKKSPPDETPGAAPTEGDATQGDAEDGEVGEDTEMGGVDEAKKDGVVDGPDGPADQTQTKSNIETAARSHLIAQAHAIILPSYSTWFDMNAIHSIEKKALPEWFNSRNRSKTPATYKDTRDFIVNTYRLNPSEYLTFTACRRNLCGDVCAIMRVHAFLEQWGLINYQVRVAKRLVTPPSNWHLHRLIQTRGLQTLVRHSPAISGLPQTRPGAFSHISLRQAHLSFPGNHTPRPTDWRELSRRRKLTLISKFAGTSSTKTAKRLLHQSLRKPLPQMARLRPTAQQQPQQTARA
jgi:SWIRM domain